MKKLTKKQKSALIIGTLTPVAAILLFFAVLCIVTMSMFSAEYLGRVLFHWDSDVSDYNIFAFRTGKTDGGIENWVQTLQNITSQINR